ncbi:MAG: hypothetical protein E7587_03145 [Ruminococcaceae bacterium]|nr:hypothetical protein [Oscillospiraceae bacterium]
MIIFIQVQNFEVSYAASELKKFLEEFTNVIFSDTSDGAEHTVSLYVDKTMKAHHYSIHGDGFRLNIRGGNASSVLCGVYEALSEAGILFEANGYSLPHSFDLTAFFSVNKTVNPRFKLRGIRQHINFPMDISSYSLQSAQEYIRSLARMRYNAITFHSYPGQWHESDPNNCAGHFFYGQTHPVPQNDPLTASRIHNRKYYCIPEAEAIYEDEQARAKYAQYWLCEVISTAKECGMEVTLSVEIISDDDETNISMMNTICKTYPMIDTLEIISEECGGHSKTPDITRENIVSFMAQAFGYDILNADGTLPGLSDAWPHQLPAATVSLQKMLRVLDLRSEWLADIEKQPSIRIGLYITCPATLRILRPILRHRLPHGMTMSLLPAHGALAVANNIENTETVSSDWQNTMFYSWAEFDGNMFIQQLSTDGIELLSQMPDTDSSYGFCINHWRTAENSLTISYAAEAAISAMSAHDFYIAYAEKVGISDKTGFATTCARLASLDTYTRDNLFNIGFCYVNCWLGGHRCGNLILPRQFDPKHLAHATAEYDELALSWQQLLSSAKYKEGIAFLRLMINRCRCSSLHIRSLWALDELTLIYDYDDPVPPTALQIAKSEEIISRARDLASAYLHLYGERLPDRGGEGLLASYTETVPVFINAVSATFEQKAPDTREESYDSPPMPDANAR